jgi:hypothetical protein
VAEKAEGDPVSSLAQLKEIAKKEEAPEESSDPTGDPELRQKAPKAPAPAPFAANFKLKVMDKEFEIPESFRALMKDQASEKEVREIFEKAYGLDFAKPKHLQAQKQLQETTQKFQETSTRMQTWETNAKKLETLAASEDPIEFEQFVNFWKIPKEKLYAYASHLLQLEDMSPEQRAFHERAKRDALTARQATEQVQQLQGAQTNLAVQTRLGEVDRLVSREDISEIATAYSQQRGDAEAFKKLVIERGWLASQQGKDLSAEEAIREAMAVLGYEETAEEAPAAAAPTGAPAQAPAAAPVIPSAPKKLPTLPTVGSGSGNAPVKKVVGSLAELRKIRADMLAAQN